MMNHYDYLIIGGGMAAAAAVDGIRENDHSGSIGLFSNESDPPYNRPPLTKGLWKDKELASIWRKTTDQQVDIRLDCAVTAIDPKEKRVAIGEGKENFCTYNKLLLATGGNVRRLPFEDDRIIYYRTVADYRRLRTLTETGRKFAVIGGGFIGSEIAAALTMNGKEVVMIFPGQAIGERIFPADLARHVTEVYQQKGVELLTGETLVETESQGSQSVLKTKSGREIVVDGVVAGLGITPNVDLAKAAGIVTDNGIVVDQFLRTNESDIYAAGDVANFHNPALDTRLRVEHEDNANSMGRQAGRNMAGGNEPYAYLPLFYSDLFEMGYEAVGKLDSKLETYADWKDPHKEGVVYYLNDGRVRGVLLWNVWGQVDAARELIARPGPFTPANLAGLLPKKS